MGGNSVQLRLMDQLVLVYRARREAKAAGLLDQGDHPLHSGEASHSHCGCVLYTVHSLSPSAMVDVSFLFTDLGNICYFLLVEVDPLALLLPSRCGFNWMSLSMCVSHWLLLSACENLHSDPVQGTVFSTGKSGLENPSGIYALTTGFWLLNQNSQWNVSDHCSLHPLY